MKKKTIALLLGMAMLFAAFAPGVFAEEANTSTPAPTETPVETPVETPTVTPTDAPAGDATAEPTAPTTTEPTTQPTTEPTVEPTETPVVCTCEGTEEEKAAEGFKHNEGCPLYVAPAEPTPAVSYENLPVEELYALLGTMEAEAAAAVRASLSADKQAALTEYEGKLAYAEFYKALMDCTTLAEVQALVAPMSQTEAEAFMNALTPEEAEALAAHIQELAAQEPREIPETVNFTDAGPFMPPVYVGGFLRRSAARAAATNGDEENGLILSKNAVANNDGSYTITLDAYVTGNVVTTTTTIPVDIVLVLDQSGSMAYDFHGKSTNTDTERRQYAMKQAVNNFIDEVSTKYTTEADHRMAIVTYSNNASLLQNWTFVDDAGKNTLQVKINGLPKSPYGATNVDAGMARAEALMGSGGYNYTGNNTNRQKVVIVFTDGVPTTKSDFDTGVASAAIGSAKSLKDAGVTVYCIGIFNGADPTQMYGSAGFDKISDGTIGSNWSNFSFWMIGDIKKYDIPAGNRFLNLLSNNYTGATEIGLKEYSATFGGIGYRGWEITKNFDRTANNYYLTADDSKSLDEIFLTISQQIQTPSIELGTNTVVKDVISPYFTVPENTSGIKLYTEDYNGKEFDGTRDVLNNATVEIKDDTVSVTGFDFTENFVSDTVKQDGSFGKKLIIEFTVTQKNGFLGGNGVPTNGDKSGVYDKDGNVVENFEVPTVNVPIPDITVTVQDKNVYLLNGLTAEELRSGATATVVNVELNLDPTVDNYGLEAWQTEYVNITVAVKDKDSNVISDKLENLTDDTTYTIEVTVTPKTANPTSSAGTPATEKSGVNSPAADINVFKPELTFKDSEAYYGAEVPELSGNLTKTEWKHGNTLDMDMAVTMIGDKPTLDINYTPDADKIESGKINTKQDIGVDVTVKIRSTDVTDKTAFHHTDCTGETCTLPEGKEFLIHVKTCTLEIKKSGDAGDESYVFDVLKDGTKYSEVTVWGNGTETLCELPVGNYTIAENTGWSWRYTANNGGTASLSATSPTGSITCNNTKTNDYWLNGFSQVVRNIFGVTPAVSN